MCTVCVCLSSRSLPVLPTFRWFGRRGPIEAMLSSRPTFTRSSRRCVCVCVCVCVCFVCVRLSSRRRLLVELLAPSCACTRYSMRFSGCIVNVVQARVTEFMDARPSNVRPPMSMCTNQLSPSLSPTDPAGAPRAARPAALHHYHCGRGSRQPGTFTFTGPSHGRIPRSERLWLPRARFWALSGSGDTTTFLSCAAC